MRRFFGRILAWIGGLVVLVVMVVIGVTIYWVRTQEKLPNKVVLAVRLEGEVRESLPQHPLGRLVGMQKTDLHQLIGTLHGAAEDGRVAGVVMRIGNASLGMAQIQEVREAVLRLRRNGKFAFAYADTFGEAAPGMGAYYLAAAFEKIWLQPAGDVNITGLLMQAPFVKGALDKLEINPQVAARKEYKNAANMFTEDKFTAAHKEATESILRSLFGQWVKGVAEGRKLTEDKVKGLVDEAPFGAEDAKRVQLVDALGSWKECEEEAKSRAGQDAKVVQWMSYAHRALAPSTKGPGIALIHGSGMVVRGPGEYNPLNGNRVLGADEVADAFRAAVADKDIKAIVFRVDSPGGSVVGSETVRQEILKAKQAGKPVIVSMGNLAGSGGYYIAMDATKIVADPASITGSIGVLSAKFVPTPLLNKWGITFDEVHTGKHATLWDPMRPYSAEEWALVNRWLDRVYDDFTSKVADGRHLPKDKVLELAKGRIWTGEEAKTIGLVDELGGLPTAMILARQTLGLQEKDPVQVEVFPRVKHPFRMFMQQVLGQEGAHAVLSVIEPEASATNVAMAQALQEVQPLVRNAETVAGLRKHYALEMPFALERF